jgi:hypothetical protein
MTKENNFTRGIAENLERGDKDYAHSIQCWQRHIEHLVCAALGAGFLVGVNDGEETTLEHASDVETIMDALWTTDEDYLLFYRIGEAKHFGWVYLIYGNGPDEVTNDWTTLIHFS